MFTNEIIMYVSKNVIKVSNYRSQYQGFQEANMDFVYDASVITLGKYPKDSKSTYHRDTYTLRFIASLTLWNETR